MNRKSHTARALRRDFIPHDESLPVLRDAVQRCEGCGLYAFATQAVFGEGPTDAQVMLVGEQPGDKEDVEGAPFVGPAGQLLDRALVDAGIDRSTVYVTNIVKHFKWKRAGHVPGKRRLHDKPNQYEVTACKPWLEAEIAPRQAARRRVPGVDRGPGFAGHGLSRDQAARRGVLVRARPADHGHSASVVHPARARRGRART